jgi:hypothetical protein
LLLVASAAVLAACGGDNAPQVPTALEAAVTTTLSAPAGTQASVVPAVTLRDAAGRGIANTYVHFAVAGGGWVVNDSARTDAKGFASSGGWTLGIKAGPQSVTATAPNLSAVAFTAQAAAGTAARLVRLSPDSQIAVVNTPIGIPPSVRVVDQYDNPVAGATVTFVAQEASGNFFGPISVSGTDGIATCESWIMNSVVGTQLARADVVGIPTPAIFLAIAVPGPPTHLRILSSNGINAVVGASFASFGSLPSVRVSDSFDNAVANVPVTFTPSRNSGTVSPSTVLSNAAGVATLGEWILGSANTQTLVATSTTMANVQALFTVFAASSQFTISVRYIGGEPSARQQMAVSRAVDRWKAVIVGRSGMSRVVMGAGACGREWAPALNETITNVLILAKIGPIDGAGAVLGNGNSCLIHATTGLTALGTMLFDSEDLSHLERSGLIDVVILHEMGHVLGIGSLWPLKRFLVDAGTADPIFTGPDALTQFALTKSGTYLGRPVPVENFGGSGTANVHWRESVFGNELMTGYVNEGQNPLSRVTIASLRDLGYDINLDAADSYNVMLPSLRSPLATSVRLPNDILDTPIYTTDTQGKLGIPKPRSN